ncbi:hypothetical protein NL676_003475 [Syzygium grande]|nr:hypothetical protein NL676_003475 [Syzygium grande]
MMVAAPLEWDDRRGGDHKPIATKRNPMIATVVSRVVFKFEFRLHNRDSIQGDAVKDEERDAYLLSDVGLGQVRSGRAEAKTVSLMRCPCRSCRIRREFWNRAKQGTQREDVRDDSGCGLGGSVGPFLPFTPNKGIELTRLACI